MELMQREQPDSGAGLGCAQIRATLQWAHAMATQGEVDAMRGKLREAGLSDAAAAARYRAVRAAQAKAAAERAADAARSPF